MSKEKAIAKDFEDLRKLLLKGIEALSTPSSYLLVPKGTPEELGAVFSIPISL
ncbi:uncharacterized protein CLAFUR5_20227 [Fulvia fulva]|uniref:uncharacterized protein n=1 Tax=Passalora fulva TaxID=5499 RepID=UPI0028529B51|nr:uncharacterized protein CLAFUR5_20226 [Fulvia fulva]XP_059319031.1 uncharacterized protein CLAFUR5_20227 [Fulvia fulva]KAK4621670.1 hypothetical protein CLAFUR4_06913 [Fulvia fulva]KAK4622414.1 hypothetical protein CLAFUR0_06911 [Fulvia fulva]KAK4622415.1 hypothetical protein CLAFUR0_06910 [Fulvia fulva]WMI38926.1 hypothetical protein CLAFUR5_20226 [Fulvia fulva]WMI38927.1 hypothetical protein CLAFUR5_20227 [Fulvia fulva]